MKRKLLSVAILTAVVPVAHAATDAGPKVYGQADIGIARTDTGTTDGFDVRSNSSRFGIKGSEDLGALEGFYKIEFSVDLVDGSATNNDLIDARDQYLGIGGDFGQVFVGRKETPFKLSQGSVDLFSDQSDIKAFLGGEEREKNLIGYMTPDMGGLSASIVFQPGEQADDNLGADQDGLADAFSMAAVYEVDDIYLAAAYDMNVAWGFFGSGLVATTYSTTAATRTDALRLVAAIKMDNFGFGGLFQTAEQADVATPVEQTGLLLSAYAMMDQTKFEFQYGSSAHEQTGVADVDMTYFGLGAEQQLSERTHLYALFSTQTNEVGATETDSDLLMVGAKHKF